LHGGDRSVQTGEGIAAVDEERESHGELGALERFERLAALGTRTEFPRRPGKPQTTS
jgi:hypothetical protein